MIVLATASARAEPDIAVVNGVPGDAGKAAIDALASTIEAAVGPGPRSPALRSALEDALVVRSPEPTLRRAAAIRQQAFDAYAAFKYKSALTLIEEATTVVLETLPSTPGYSELGELMLLRAQVQLQAGNASSAARDFRFASRLAGGTSLDPGLYSPVVIRAQKGALTANPPEAVVTVAGHESAAVELDGKPGDETLRTEAGVHVLVVSRPGYATFAALVDVAAGPSTQTITLEALELGERVRDLRASLSRGELSPLDAGGEISQALDARRLLVFSLSSGRVVVQRYDRATHTLSSAGPATSATIETLLGPSLQPQVVVTDPDKGGAAVSPARESWLSRNQTPVLVSGGVVLITAAVVATLLLTRGEGESGVALDTFCGFGVPCE